MGYAACLIWLIVGIILLTITIFVHKHTYDCGYRSKVNDKLSAPRWLYILFTLLAFIPVLNVIAFIIGAVFYCAALSECDIVFHCESKWCKSLIGWLTKEI